MRAAEYIDELAARRRYFFTSADAREVLGVSHVAAQAALRRLAKKHMIATPIRGFHVILPPERRHRGCLPPAQYIPWLMERLGQPYYCGLLSAAAHYGARHQSPMVFQVVVDKPRRRIRCGFPVKFVVRKNVTAVPTEVWKTERGEALVSTPEATLVDVVGHPLHCGGFDNVANILITMVEDWQDGYFELDGARLVHAAKTGPLAWAQRLGFLLEEFTETSEALLGPLSDHVAASARDFVGLKPWRPIRGARRSKRWKVAVNGEVDPDV